MDDTFVITKAETQSGITSPHQQPGSPHPVYSGTYKTRLTAILDTLVAIEPNNTLSTTIYRKPTHTDQYLHWDSNRHITAKQSVYNTLAHRAKVVSSSQETLDKELQHIKTALQACQFPKWPLNQWHHRFLNNNQSNTNTSNNNSTNSDNNHNNNTTKRNITLVVPYIKGISEKFKTLCKTKGVQVHFKGTNTLRTQLVNPKDKDPKTHKIGIIYHYKCPHINCPEAYIGESGRALGERVKEHLKAPSPIFHHSTTTGHPLYSDNFNIIHKEVHNHSRTIKEAMFIHVNDPTLDRNLGKYQPPHIWDSILQASPMLQLKTSTLPHLPTPPP